MGEYDVSAMMGPAATVAATGAGAGPKPLPGLLWLKRSSLPSSPGHRLRLYQVGGRLVAVRAPGVSGVGCACAR